MKTFCDWKLFVFLLLVGIGFVACGDDDEQSEIINGVNVIKGKKLVELRVYREKGNIFPELAGVYKIEYDSIGRLSKVIGIDYDKDQLFDVLRIDYYIKVAYLLKNSKYMFMLNKNGYISQIGTCSCEYNDEGYLIGGNSTKQVLQLVRSQNEIIQSFVEEIASGNIAANYFNYSEDSDSGELCITMNSPDTRENFSYLYGIDASFEARREFIISCLIAYQSGLFGKTDIHANSFSKSSQVKAVVKRITPYTTVTINCDLQYE